MTTYIIKLQGSDVSSTWSLLSGEGEGSFEDHADLIEGINCA